MKNQKIDLQISNSAKEIILEKGTDYNYGARPLRRAIQNLVEDKVAEKIIDEKSNNNENKILVLYGENGDIMIKDLQ